MRIAVAKPEQAVVGGFELVMREVVRRLKLAGHDVTLVAPSALTAHGAPFGVQVRPAARRQARAAFAYLELASTFRSIGVDAFDLLISSQPPSFALHHRHHLSLFFHHHRALYDLSELLIEGGTFDADAHRAASAAVRRIEQPWLEAVTWFLTPSRSVSRRLAAYNGIEGRVGPFTPGLGFRVDVPDLTARRWEHALCVSRHEFPKRTELFAGAMAVKPPVPSIAVGEGLRRTWVQRCGAEAARTGWPDAAEERSWWLRPPPLGLWHRGRPAPTTFVSHATPRELDGLYRDALCVVAPAYEEDYGLTAIEAMAYGKPVIACDDGGGLTELVTHGVNGLVVPPRMAAIAEAVGALASDRALAVRLGEAGRELASTFTWERSMGQIDRGIEEVLSGLAS